MINPVCIKLPWLHELKSLAGNESPICGGFCRLEPGLEENFPHWRPDNYPFAPRIAGSIFRRLAELDLRDLETLRAAGQHMNGEAEIRGEMADLANFAQNDRGRPDGEETRKRLALEQTQKVLLWLWLQEERLVEITALSGKYAHVSRKLAASFGEGNAQSGNDSAFVEEEKVDEDRDALLPSWRVYLLNAAFFVPPGIPILAEGPMSRDLQERLDFRPDGDIGADLGLPRESFARLHSARAPLWVVLGQQRPFSSGMHFLNTIYNSERIWLIWKGK